MIASKNTAEQKPSWYQRVFQRVVNLLDSPEKIQRSAYAFMPAALEIQETPPSPIGRAISWTIILLFIIAVIWGLVGKIDVVAVAQGKIIPSGRVKTIQPLEIGTVKAIHIKEGQSVSEGELLISLDSTATQADMDRLQQQLNAAELQKSRQALFHQLLSLPDLPAQWPTQAKTTLDKRKSLGNKQQIIRETQLLEEQISEYQFRQRALGSELEKQQAEQQAIQASINKFERTLPLITERVQSVQLLLDKNMVARTQFLQLEQERIEQEQDLVALQAEHLEMAASIKATQAQLKAVKAETQKNNLNELNRTAQHIATIEQDLIKAIGRNLQKNIRSPISGTVQQLAVHTIGGIVTPAQELMMVIPEGSNLEVEAMILNKDIGFVSNGQSAEVKIDTFNFTKYGTIDAHISQLSSDAIQHEKLGLVYMAKVQIAKDSLWVSNREVNLSPGMSTSVEIKTGKRRIIEYFLSPLLRYKQESIRER